MKEKAMKRAAFVFGIAFTLNAQDDPAQAAERARKRVEETVVAGVSTGGTFQFISGQMLQANTVKGQPYSGEAVNETKQTLADGNRIVHRSTTRLYRDSEGRERREESLRKLGPWSADGPPLKAIFISDPIARVSYTLQEGSRTATKIPLPAVSGRRSGPVVQTFTFTHSDVGSGAGMGIGAGSNGERIIRYDGRSTIPDKNSKTEKLGTQTMEGVLVEGTRTTVTIPAGQIGNERDLSIVDERWFSPELQVTVMSKRSDPRMGETTYKLTNISRTEPARSLFEVPADYSISDGPQI